MKSQFTNASEYFHQSIIHGSTLPRSGKTWLAGNFEPFISHPEIIPELNEECDQVDGNME